MYVPRMGDDETTDDQRRRRLSDRIVATSALLYWVIDADSRIASSTAAREHLLA